MKILTGILAGIAIVFCPFSALSSTAFIALDLYRLSLGYEVDLNEIPSRVVAILMNILFIWLAGRRLGVLGKSKK